MPIRKSVISGSSVNDFVLSVGSTGDTTYILDNVYPAGTYTVASLSDTTYDIYLIAADGTSAGYTKSARIEATEGFKEIVILGASANEIFTFEYSGLITNPTSSGDVASAGAFITSVSVSSLPNVDDTTTITGGNFAADVQVFFTGQDSAELEAKSLTRNSSAELVATRPDALDVDDSPYTVKVVNPGITEPTGSSAHLLSNSITAGTNPVWQTAAAQIYNIGTANTITLTASDTENSDIDYAIIAGNLPAGLSLDGETGVISGTPSGGTEGDQTVFTVRATDAGGNFVDREFTFTANSAPTWTTVSSDIGDNGQLTKDEAVNFQFVANGGSAGGTLSYFVQSGSLPGGTSLSSSGLLTGTPDTEETATFTLRVIDEGGLFADREFIVTVILPFTATGGTVTTDATYTYHTFISNGTFTTGSSEDVNFDVLVVAGGGGGGSPYSGGGGGAGGVLLKTSHSLSSASYSVVVGLGGTGFDDSSGRLAGDNGQDSVFDSLTAFGGGGGGGDDAPEDPKDGGSGGGMHWDTGSGGQSIQTSNNGGIGYGNPGGSSSTASSACGGGGAGSAGESVDVGSGGNGGDGILLSEWSSATSTGESGYYAGGGGGSGKNGQNGDNGTNGNGGLGGGGNGAIGPGEDGLANTGGGGGGASSGGDGGNGGSGIVIIRYPTPE